METDPHDNLKKPTFPSPPPSPPPSLPPLHPPSQPPSPPPSSKKPEMPSIPAEISSIPVSNPELNSAPVSSPKAFSSFEKVLDESPVTGAQREMPAPISQEEPLKAPETPKPPEEEKIIDADINFEHAGLQLNPDDFIVRQRPKTVTVVPKDAKSKLKTSPFDVVTNQPSSPPTVPQPVAPFKLLEKEQSEVPITPIVPQKEQIIEEAPPLPIVKHPKVTTVPIQKQAPPPLSPGISPSRAQPVQSVPNQVKEQNVAAVKEQAPSKMFQEMNQQQKSELEKSLMDLKIKKANLSKIALDYDMKELTGEITADELNEKKQKLEKIVESVNDQIKDLERMLNQE